MLNRLLAACAGGVAGRLEAVALAASHRTRPALNDNIEGMELSTKP
ncbi:MAG TPA: hypothetical protein VGP82_24420 [Ktedonobacterales bacterium]|jgi:hypothetical protein|nr:hypothetical protein [Ktedonobacterales bacterium]